MSEEMVVRQCAPTLAGIKTGSLFPCPCTDRDALLDEVRQLNRRLSPKGLCLLPLRFTEGSALLYLYRPATLRRDLSDDLARRLLAEAGYDGGSCGRKALGSPPGVRQAGAHGPRLFRAHRHKRGGASQR